MSNPSNSTSVDNIYVSVLPDAPSSVTATEPAHDDLDFDDLTRRFEALKKK